MFEKIIGKINSVIRIVAIVLIAAMASIMFINVVCRYVFQFSFTWVAETARYLLIWAAFLSIAALVNRNENLKMDFIVQLFPDSKKRIISIGVNIFSLLFFVLIAIIGFYLVAKTGNQKASSVSIPMNLVYSVIPVSSVLMCLGAIYRLELLVKNKNQN